MDNEYKIRINAIRRYLSGEKPFHIYRSLSKSRQWLWYWLNRYDPHNPEWFKDKSKSNKTIHNKIDSNIEQIICNIRKRLTKTKYSQLGPLAIQWEMKKLGVEQIPHTRTISRIIKRNDLVKDPKKYEKRNKLYPEIKPRKPMYCIRLISWGHATLAKENRTSSTRLTL